MRLLLKTNKSPQSRVRRNRVVMQCLALIGAWLVATSSASAQTTDLTLHDSQGGGAVPGIGNVFTLDEALGIRPGAGMDRFHLFEKFNLGAGDTVEWTASLPTRSIFNLISGSDPSQINGTLRSTLSTDIYLINPAGVIFNESASLNLAGSFFASTADALEFSNGASLEIPGVDQAQILALGAIDFESFGFLDSNESIEINGASLSVGNDAVLSFASARSVRVEGTAGITEAQLAAGRVNLSAERGGVRFENARVTSTAGSPSGGSGIFAIAEKDIELNPDTILRAQGPGNSLGIGLSGRNISIRGTNTRVLSTNGAGDGGSIEFVANHLLSVTDGAQVRAEATGTGRAADIEFIAENVLMVEGEVLTSSDSAANSQGRIDMEVEEVVNLQQSRIASNLPNSGSGVIHVAAALVVLQDESSIVADPVLGHIEITADLIIRSTESEIRADTVALSGTEMVRSLHTDLNERLEVLPQSFFENRARLDPHCALGSGDATGSLVVEKRRAFPDSPEQLRVPSYDSITTQARLASAATKSTPWAILLATFRSLPEPSGADWLVLASRAEAAGLLSSAQAAADAGIEQAAVSPQPPQTEIALRTLRGRIQARTQDHTQAAADLDYAMNLANRIGDDNLLAKVYLDYAVAKARNGNGVGALQALAKAREHATRGGDGELIRIIDADHQSIALEFPTTQSTPPPLQSVRHGEIENTGAMAAEMHQVLATLRSPNALAAAAKAKQAAADRLVELTSLSETLGFESLASYGWGFLAQLYAEQGRHDDALTLTDWAIASVLGLTEGPLHRWQAQRADLLNRRGDYTAAAQSYAMALKAANRLGYAAILEKVPRGPLPSDTLPGEPLIGPYIDVLLRLADKAPNETARQEQLAVVRNLIEEQRVQELKDYFQDPCIAAQETRSAETLPRTLVLHPIVLADRLVVLASSASGISTHTIPIARELLTETLQTTSMQLRDRTTNRHMIGAALLYDWLVRPVETQLSEDGIETLVFVPGAGLRTFPMSALYDNQSKKYLVEKIAIGTTQGLSLTEPNALIGDRLTVLRAGLTQQVKDEAPLRFAQQELDAIGALFAGSELIDDNFSRKNLTAKLDQQSFDVIHIASHGSFARKGKRAYLLTAHERLGLESLARIIRRTRFRERPTELITLSACESAVGDEQAALGLAGLAIRAGARSTLATLWRVNDEATADLMNYFYTHLATGDESRASALRKAQRAVLADPVLRHPAYWAPFVLLGNWQ